MQLLYGAEAGAGITAATGVHRRGCDDETRGLKAHRDINTKHALLSGK